MTMTGMRRRTTAATAIVALMFMSMVVWAGSSHGASGGMTRGGQSGVKGDVIAASPPTWGYFKPGFNYLAFAPDGTLYASDCWNARIYKVTSKGSGGHVSVFAGAGPGGFTQWSRLKAETGTSSPVVKRYGWATVAAVGGDGQHPTDAYFKCIEDLTFDPAGDMYVADHLNSRIREITADGFVQTVGGVGPGFKSWGPWTPGVGAAAGDGGPATHGIFDAPLGMAFDAHGNLFIADRDHEAIREIDTHGTLSTVAGTGHKGYNGDDQPATEATINRPVDVVFDTAGDMYISDEDNRRIRMVDTHGTITTFAGTGEYGCGGDGGPAVDASFRNPNDIVFAPDGSMLISDNECHDVRRIAPDGTISTFAGASHARSCRGRFGQPVRRMPVLRDTFFAYGPDGDLYFTPCEGKYGSKYIVRVDDAGITHLFAKAPNLSGI
jgi:sugar lactone lactonase YvrE